jgi:hypothetical protein
MSVIAEPLSPLPRLTPAAQYPGAGAIAMLAAGAAMLAGCGSLFPPSYRFRMTVEVETPQGVRSGSSVLEVTSRFRTCRQRHDAMTMLTGEAVAVDLPGGKNAVRADWETCQRS